MVLEKFPLIQTSKAMKEQLISFETAKLAKEKGFKELCYYYYNNKKKMQEPYLENGSSTDTGFRVELEDLLEQHNNFYHNTFSAPTQALLQKWLRETHNSNIQIHRLNGLYYCKVKYFNTKSTNTKGFSTYEEALEEGLEESLKLI